MKINKINANAKNTKRVGLLLLFAFVKLFYLKKNTFFLLGKGVFDSDQGLGEGRKRTPGSSRRGRGPVHRPKRLKLPEAAVLGPATGVDPPVRSASV